MILTKNFYQRLAILFTAVFLFIGCITCSYATNIHIIYTNQSSTTSQLILDSRSTVSSLSSLLSQIESIQGEITEVTIGSYMDIGDRNTEDTITIEIFVKIMEALQKKGLEKLRTFNFILMDRINLELLSSIHNASNYTTKFNNP